MNAAKRVNKGYKVKDIYYQKAKKRASKEHGSLANLIEVVVVAYSCGLNIVALNGEKKKYVTLDEIAAECQLREYSKVK